LLFSWRCFRYGGQQGGDETRKAKETEEAIWFGSEKIYLLLRLVLVLVLVPIGWIKIDRNRRKDHGIELISFDLLLLVSE